MDNRNSLRLVKALHTAIWGVFAACILAMPVFAYLDRYSLAALAGVAVFAEVLIIVLNGWKCPLTAVAARYTEDRRPNFDIYLPEWLARYNKEIFGSLYAAGLIFFLARWAGLLK